MPNVQVRNVPDEVHSVLVRRAQNAGQSLQQYLSDQLSQMASRPTIEEVFERIEGRRLGRISSEDVVAALDAERARR
ncbi:MAG: hypothetical protein F4Y28_08700 [Acidimicrobiia bacterium]|nr:hypothetical protein [Acidimicrobiia bacterium]MYG59704.1 hypothetical protein [Acidimicrobiia bacterium]MYJ34141.1 hypothetical protein [Acidimicrobiia bacterium]